MRAGWWFLSTSVWLGCAGACASSREPLAAHRKELTHPSEQAVDGAGGAAATRAPVGKPAPSQPYVPEAEPPPLPDSVDEKALRWPRPGLVAPAGHASCAPLRRPPGRTCPVDSWKRDEKLLELTELARAELRWDGEERTGEALARAIVANRGFVELEGCDDLFLPGAVRLLRARLLPECAEELAAPALANLFGDVRRHQPLDVDIVLALYGAALGSASARLPQRKMPAYPGTYSADRLERFVTERIEPWARAVRAELARWDVAVNELPAGSYGRLLAQIGLTRARHRFFAAYRAAPVHDHITKDFEARTAYYSRIDRALEREREDYRAATVLVARELGIQGAYGEPDLAAAALNVAGVRVSSIDRLAVPDLPYHLAAGGVQASLMRMLPPVISEKRIPHGEQYAQPVIAALLQQGLSQRLRADVSKVLADGGLHPNMHTLFAHGLVRLGLVTREARLLERAVYELAHAPDSREAQILHAIATTLLGSRDGDFVFTAKEPRRVDRRALEQLQVARDTAAEGDSEAASAAALEREARLDAVICLRSRSARPDRQSLERRRSRYEALAAAIGLARPLRALSQLCARLLAGVSRSLVRSRDPQLRLHALAVARALTLGVHGCAPARPATSISAAHSALCPREVPWAGSSPMGLRRASTASTH